jgi:hypothetical protein
MGARREWCGAHYPTSGAHLAVVPERRRERRRVADFPSQKSSPSFPRDNYLLGVELLANSWGWDLRQARYLTDPQPEQCWQGWPIRLYKATKSVKLFGYEAEFESLKKLGRDLMSKGQKMHYRRDLSWLFRD